MSKILMGPQTLIYPMPTLPVGANVSDKPNLMAVAWGGICQWRDADLNSKEVQTMFERILVPLDGSKVAEAALPVVEELVSKLSPVQKVEVTLLQVVTSLTHWVVAGEAGAPIPYTEQEVNLIRKEAQAYLDKVAEGLRSKGATVKTKVAVGNAAQEIIKASEEIPADLMAMSTHGRTGLGRWAFGSVTERVLRAGTLPVLLVRVPRKTTKP